MKPKVGQSIYYQGAFAGVVTEIEGNICHYRRPDGTPEVFIWRFDDGTNNALHQWN